MKLRKLLILFIASLMLVSTASSVLAQDENGLTPDVSVSPIGVVDGIVTIERATIDNPGWVVIHADNDGAPGPVIGYAQIDAGVNTGVEVEIDLEGETPIMHAMLHDDNGEVGVYEFPGEDTPTRIGDAIVMAAFSAEAVPAVPAEDDSEEMSEGEMMDEEMAEDDAMVESSSKGGMAPAEMPDTGGAPDNGLIVLLVVGLLALLAGSTFVMRGKAITRQ